MAAHFDLSVIAIVGINLLIGIVKRSRIMRVPVAPRLRPYSERSAAVG
jgi:multidrug efflux pump subunit AcrB